MLLIGWFLILLHAPLNSHLNVDMATSIDQFGQTIGKNKHNENQQNYTIVKH